jgi:hypothetical protein
MRLSGDTSVVEPSDAVTQRRHTALELYAAPKSLVVSSLPRSSINETA